jgi:2'-phosphotransferase
MTGGFINVSDILSLRDAARSGYTEDDVQRIVTNCSKQRFALRHTPQLQIRANQGHTMQVDDLDLIEIKTLDDVPPVVVHGTYHRAWQSIKHQVNLKH